MVNGFCGQCARSVRSLHRLAKRLRNAASIDVIFLCPKFMNPPLKLPPAVDGFEAGATVKTDEEATLLSNLFKDCGSDRKFSIGDRRPSYTDYDSIKGPLEALHRDRKCGKRQFLDRQGHKWSVKYDVGAQRASLVNEEAHTESRTPCSVPSSTHIHTFTSATHIRGHCRHDVDGRGPRASLDTFATEDSPRSDQ